MAWTTPATFATSEVVTAAKLNTHVRDNMNYLYNGRETCVLTRGSTQTIPDSSLTSVLFPTEDVDTDTMHSTVTNTDRITFTTAGVYVVTAAAIFAANATGNRAVGIGTNGSTSNLGQSTAPNVGAVLGTAVSVSGIVVAAATDYVKMTVQQTSGGNLDLAAGARFCAARIG